MKTGITDYMVRTNQIEWAPLVEAGVNTKGVFVKVLRYDEQTKRAPTILLKFEAGASYPYHNHPGDYLFTPPNFKHAVKSETGCVLLFMIPEEVEILKVE